MWKGGEELPSSADEVEFVVFPFGKNPEVLRKIVTLPKLKTVQILSAGADHILPYIPAHITLCNARGAHTPATAEWTAGVIIASIRNFPRFAAGQQAGHWDPAVSDLVAGKRVLIVGYGSIGEAVERRLAGWEVDDRPGRAARPRRRAPDRRTTPDPAERRCGRHPRPGHRGDQAAGQRRVPEDHEGRRAAGERRPRRDRRHRRAAGRADQRPAARPRSTSPTRSRCRTATRSGPRPACCSPRTSAARSAPPGERAYEVVAAQLARLAAGQPLLNVIGADGY